MSKLAESIRKISRVEPAPIGFGAGARAKRNAALLCLVRLGKDQLAGAMETAKGADFVLLEGVEPAQLKKIDKKGELPPVALTMTSGAQTEVAAARDAGVDFVVLDMRRSLAEALIEEKIGVILAVPADASDNELRFLPDLPLDALLVEMPAEPFVFSRLLDLRRISAFARTPLLVEVNKPLETPVLQTLQYAGAAGLVLTGKAVANLAEVRETIASLRPREQRREERMEVLLPAPTRARDEEEEEEHDH